MEHVVFSAAVDGVGEEFRRVSNLEEAVRVVEHLRNDLGIEDASVFALTPVPLAFRTYYRVEVPGAEVAAPLALVSEPAAAPADEPLSEPASSVDELTPELVEVPSLVPLMKSSSLQELESIAALAGAVETDELASSADEGELSEPGVHQISELPAMLAPGLEPRDESESEHSLGYFAR